MAGWAIAGLAAADIGSKIYQSEMSRASARDQMFFQDQFAKDSRVWMKMMSDTAMQRRVADLKAAGLNPMLAYTQGPASSPTVGNQPGAGYDTYAPDVSKTVSSAIDLKIMKAELARKKMETRLIQKQAALTNAKHNTELIDQQIMYYGMPGIATESEIDKSKWGQRLRYINRVTHSAKDLIRKR